MASTRCPRCYRLELGPACSICSRSTLVASNIVAWAFDILFSKAILHQAFKIIQQVTIHTSHSVGAPGRALLWFGPKLEDVSDLSKIHLVSSYIRCGVIWVPLIAVHSWLVHEQPVIKCSCVSASAHIGQADEIGNPPAARFSLTGSAFAQSLHMNDLNFGQAFNFHILCHRSWSIGAVCIDLPLSLNLWYIDLTNGDPSLINGHLSMSCCIDW